MNNQIQSGRPWLIYFSIFIGLILLIIPLKNSSLLLAQLRPEFALLIVFYWALALPNKVGLTTAWIVGILQDSLTGSLIGSHALAFVLISFFIVRFYHRIRISSKLSQVLTIFILMLIYKVLFLWVTSATGKSNIGIEYWYSAISSAIFWIPTFSLLRGIRIRYDIK